jgi:hypothetical protein
MISQSLFPSNRDLLGGVVFASLDDVEEEKSNSG